MQCTRDALELTFGSDDNGNLTENSYENVAMSYNFLNLPAVANEITYTYLADGTRLSARKSDGSGVIARGSFAYVINSSGDVNLESIAHSEGRIYVRTPDGDVWDCWNVTDHLGNVRSVINPDGTSSELILEQSDYLPFGTRINLSSPLMSNLQRWHYAGKEYQKFGATDLGLIDFGARYFSPFLGRWNSIDPLANKYLATSTYGYCGSNPINFVDPYGEDWYLSHESGYYIWFDTHLPQDGYSYVGGKGALLGEYEEFVDMVLSSETGYNCGGLYVEGQTIAFTDPSQTAINIDSNMDSFMSEFYHNTGPNIHVLTDNHPYTKDISKNPIVVSSQNNLVAGNTEKPGMITNVKISWGIKDVFITKEWGRQFIGSARYDGLICTPNTILNVVSDSKSRTSLFFHFRIDNKSRTDSKHFGNAYYVYLWESTY